MDALSTPSGPPPDQHPATGSVPPGHLRRAAEESPPPILGGVRQSAEERLRLERNLLDHPDEVQPLEDVPVLILPDAYCPGGGPGYRISLLDVLQEPWPCDVHFTQYVSDGDVRLRKDMPHPGLSFETMCVDLDGVSHEPPTDDAWWRLVQTTSWMDPQPNAVYRTRAGARLLYVIAPLSDPLEFERRRLDLLRVVDHEKGEVSPYVVDPTKDWTRLFRAPRVVRTNQDGTAADLRSMPIWVWHTRRLRTWRARRSAAPPVVRRLARVPIAARTRCPGSDRIVERYLATQHVPGCRNSSLFRVLCWIAKTYEPGAGGPLIEKVQDHALAEGLSESEVDAAARSAKATVEREEPRDA